MLVAYRAYVADPLDNSVAVLNTFTGEILTRVSTGVGPITAKLEANTDKVYVTNTGSNTVTVFDARSNVPITTITVGTAPADVAFNSISTRAYVTNSGSNTVSVIDTTTSTVVATVAVGTTPIGVAVSPDDSTVYVANSGSNTVSVINTATNTVVGPPIAVGTAPRFITVAPDGKVWVACSGSNNVFVIDPGTNSVLTSIPVGTTPNAVKVNPAGTFAYVANSGSGNVSVISTLGYSVVATIPVGTTPSRIAFDTNPEVSVVRAFVTNNGSNSISIINTTTNSVIATLGPPIALAGGPEGIDIGPLGAAESPGEPIDLLDPYVLEEINESVCIIVEKVFASCQQRECFPDFTVTIPGVGPFVFQDISFANGIIVPGSIIITPIPGRPNFSRVRLTIQVPFTARVLDTSTGTVLTVTGTLPDIMKDIVMFIPPARTEFDLNLRVETRSDLLTTPTFTDSIMHLQIGVFVVVKVTGLVQLLVPAFGYCPEPAPCEQFAEHPTNFCDIFFNPVKTPFPTDFFPPQLEDLN